MRIIKFFVIGLLTLAALAAGYAVSGVLVAIVKAVMP
jgi:hypothetical protein